MNRKTFIEKTAGALLLAVPVYALLNCSSSSSSDDYDSNNNTDTNTLNCIENGASGSISANHGHSLTVSGSDVNIGTEKTYNIDGSSNHSHNVTITVANFTSLKNNQQITVTSTTGSGHTHSVTVSCA